MVILEVMLGSELMEIRARIAIPSVIKKLIHEMGKKLGRPDVRVGTSFESDQFSIHILSTQLDKTSCQYFRAFG